MSITSWTVQQALVQSQIGGPVQWLQYETLLFWWEETKKDGCLVMSVEVGILAYED